MLLLNNLDTARVGKSPHGLAGFCGIQSEGRGAAVICVKAVASSDVLSDTAVVAQKLKCSREGVLYTSF